MLGTKGAITPLVGAALLHASQHTGQRKVRSLRRGGEEEEGGGAARLHAGAEPRLAPPAHPGPA